MMFNEAVLLKDVVELPAKTVSVSLGRAAVTSRVAVTQSTKMGTFAEAAHLLSEKPLRRPECRKLHDEK